MYGLLWYFTHWTQIETFLQILLSILGSSKNSSYGVLALHHIFFELAFFCNIVTVTCYWPFIYKEHYERMKNKPLGLFLIHYSHSAPSILIFVNFMMTDVVFRSSHYIIIAPVGFTYGLINYLEVKRIGKPIYPFLTWKDSTAVLILSGVMLLCCFIWFGVTTLTVMIKRGVDIKKGKREREI